MREALGTTQSHQVSADYLNGYRRERVCTLETDSIALQEGIRTLGPGQYGAPAQVGDTSWQIKEVGDFDGDWKADILWQNTTSGWTYIWFMDGATIASDGVPGVVSDSNWQIMN
jgi:hypothetical protein